MSTGINLKSKSKSKKKKFKQRKPKLSLWERDGALHFLSSGLDTEQSRDDFMRRERKRQYPNESDDCFVDDSSDDELEVTELAHKDSEESGVKWGVKANKIMEKMGWKRGEGLGKNSAGVRNPITANLKYDRIGGNRPGLGFQKPVEEKYQKTTENKECLPKIDPHRVKIFQNRTDREIAEQRAFALGLTDKFKLNSLDMKIDSQNDQKNMRLSKIQLKKCDDLLDEIKNRSIQAKEALIRVGLHIHEQAKSEILGSRLEMYKQEAARLWRATAKLVNRDCPWDLYLDFIIRVREVFLDEDLKGNNVIGIDDSDDDLIVVSSSTVPSKRKKTADKSVKREVKSRSSSRSVPDDIILLD